MTFVILLTALACSGCAAWLILSQQRHVAGAGVILSVFGLLIVGLTDQPPVTLVRYLITGGMLLALVGSLLSKKSPRRS